MGPAPFSIEQLWIFALLAGLVIVSAVALSRGHRRLREIPRPIAIGVGAATVAALVIPLFVVEPAFVHISMHGPLILESMLGFPSPGVHRHEFGQGGYVVLGLAAALFGRSAEVVMAANAVLSAATTPLVGFVAARWSGRPSAALYASAAWATSPFIARLARSEDIHVVAMLFVAMALTWAELASSSRSRLALVGAVISMQLAMWTRQTTYLGALLLVGILVERRWRAARAGEPALEPGPLKLAIGVVVGSLAVRVISTLGEGGDAMIVPVLVLMVRDARLAAANLFVHPFLSPARLSILVPTLGLVGAVYLVRRSPVRLSFAAFMAGMMIVTLPASYRSVGVAWSFRLPLYALALVAVGVGAATIERAWETRRGRSFSDRALLAAAAACGIVGLLATGTLENRSKNAEFVEYTYLRDTLQTQPRPFTLAGVRLQEPSSTLPMVIAARLGVPVVVLDTHGATDQATEPRGPWIFFEGLSCHAHSIPQLFEETLASKKAEDADIEHFLIAGHDPRQGFGIGLAPRPTQMRAGCAAAIARALPRAPEGPLVKVDDDPPMVIYDVPEVRLRFFESTPAAAMR